jgi:hypothetical protein
MLSAVCISIHILPTNFRMPEPVFMTRGMHIMAPEHMPTTS